MKAKIFLPMLCACICALSNFVYADTATHVYECIVDGQHVFSDHVCGDNAIDRDVVVANRMDKVEIHLAGTKTQRQPKRVRSSHGADALATRQQRCAKIRKSREALNDQMRAGFTARQDEKLHQRLRKLDDDYHELRCSGA
jgi:hypothetical protein